MISHGAIPEGSLRDLSLSLAYGRGNSPGLSEPIPVRRNFDRQSIEICTLLPPGPNPGRTVSSVLELSRKIWLWLSVVWLLSCHQTADCCAECSSSVWGSGVPFA